MQRLFSISGSVFVPYFAHPIQSRNTHHVLPAAVAFSASRLFRIYLQGGTVHLYRGILRTCFSAFLFSVALFLGICWVSRVHFKDMFLCISVKDLSVPLNGRLITRGYRRS